MSIISIYISPSTFSNLECENDPSDNHSVVIETTNQRQSDKLTSSEEKIKEIDLNRQMNVVVMYANVHLINL